MILEIPIILLCLWYLYFRCCYNYWRKKGVSFIEPTFPVGNILPFLLKKENLSVWTVNIYNYFKDRGQKHGGIYFFNRPIYFPIDPEIIKSIMTTHFETHFPSHGVKISTKTIPPLARNIFFQNGETWKQIRSGLTPAFTPVKIKNIYFIFIELTDRFINLIGNAAEKNSDEVELKAIAVNHTVDIILNAALGLQANACEDSSNEIYGVFKKMAAPPKLLDIIKLVFRNRGLDGPGDFFELLFHNKEIEELFIKITNEIVSLRDDGKIVRDDFVNALLKLREQLGLSLDDLSGQIYSVYMAGHETTATALTFALHSLAHYKNVQIRLREEITKNLGTDFKKFSYEALTTLPYLDAVIKGTYITVQSSS